MSIQDALIGAPPPDGSEAQKMIAAALRAQQNYGNIGVISGDPSLAAAGKGYISDAQNVGNTTQAARQELAQRLQTGEYQQGMLKHSTDVLAETHRENDQKDAEFYDRLQSMMDLLKEKGAQKGAGGPEYTKTDFGKAQNSADYANQLEELANYFETHPSVKGQLKDSLISALPTALGNAVQGATYSSEDQAARSQAGILKIAARNALDGKRINKDLIAEYDRAANFMADGIDAKTAANRMRVMAAINRHYAQSILGDENGNRVGLPPLDSGPQSTNASTAAAPAPIQRPDASGPTTLAVKRYNPVTKRIE